jgi:DGQHR domain-containing protein
MVNMKTINSNIIKGTRVVQNKQDFVVSIFTINQILKFTKFTNRLIVGYDEEGLPIYNSQIQRYVENSRVKKISDFLINDPDATFPTNLVLHIPNEIINNQVDTNDSIEIEIDEKVFRELDKVNGNVYITIIDGQHRIRGIELAIVELKQQISDLTKTLRGSKNIDLEKKLRYFKTRLEDLNNIQLVVTFFIDKTLEYQAMIFSTINRTQKKVSADLVSSLFGLNSGDTPQKTALQIVLRLNGHVNSPFHKRIKLYGGTYSRENSPPLSQASMVSSIVKLISENIRESETDRYKQRKELHKRSSSSNKHLPFRKYYANNKDNIISDILFFYFNSLKEIFKDSNNNSYWVIEDSKPSNIFHTTVGYDTLLKILEDFLKENKNEGVDFKKLFSKYLKKANHIDINNINRFSFNNRGKKFLYLDMSLAIWPADYVKNPKDKREQELRELEQAK